MTQHISRFYVLVEKIGSGTLQLQFPKDKDIKDKSQSVGLVLLQHYLTRNFPRVKFSFEVSKKNNYDLLTFNSYAESLLAIHEIFHSDSFLDKSLLLDGAVQTSFTAAYDILSSVVKSEVARGVHKELESVLKEVLFDHDRIVFQRLKNLIENKFKEAGFANLDPALKDLIERIDKIDDRELVFLISKKDILLTHLAYHLKMLCENDLTNKITLYASILNAEALDTEEALNELRDNYNKYPKHLITAFEKANTDILVENEKIGRWSPSVQNFYNKIQMLRHYGDKLKIEVISKGQIVCDLADDLKVMADEFFSRKNITELELAKFKANFARELKGNSLDISIRRLNLETIFKNILIALSGIGLLALGVKVAHSWWYYKRVTFFFSDPKTTSEKYYTEVQTARNLLNFENLPNKTKG